MQAFEEAANQCQWLHQTDKVSISPSASKTVADPSHSDINLYFGYIQTLKNKDLLQFFTALRELSQIYLVDPSDAKELATIIADGDRFHGIFRAEEVYQFAERRADWYQIKSKVERAMYGIGCCMM